MFKNKLKSLFILLAIALISLSSVSFADLEEDLVDANIIDATGETEATEITEESIDKLPEDVLYYMPNATNIDDKDNKNLISVKVDTAVKNHDEYLIGTDINVNYDIEGNLYIIGNNVTISSKVIGNAFICANNITITKTGYISNSLYATANNIYFNGRAYDIYTTSKNFNFDGSTFRDIHSAANNITLNGEIGRDANVAGENFFVGGKIAGNLNYSAEKEISIQDGIVAGSIKYEKLKEFNIRPNYLIIAACFVGLILVLWLFMKWLAPSFLLKTDSILTNGPIKTLGIGLLSLITVPGIAVLLMITGVAAFAGILLLITYFVLACISSSIFIITINNILAKKIHFNKAYQTFLLLIVTSIIAWALTIIPYFGGVFSVIYALYGFGIVIRKLLNNRKEIVAE